MKTKIDLHDQETQNKFEDIILSCIPAPTSQEAGFLKYQVKILINDLLTTAKGFVNFLQPDMLTFYHFNYNGEEVEVSWELRAYDNLALVIDLEKRAHHNQILVARDVLKDIRKCISDVEGFVNREFGP